MIIIVIAVIVSVVSAAACDQIALAKGREPLPFTIAGFLLGPVGVVITMLAKSQLDLELDQARHRQVSP